MINRRKTLALLSIGMIATASPLFAQQSQITVEELQSEFKQRNLGFRQMAQQGLQGNGYYQGTIDGIWGAGTARAYEALMASERYRRHARNWTWSRDIQIVETLIFLNSDEYL